MASNSLPSKFSAFWNRLNLSRKIAISAVACIIPLTLLALQVSTSATDLLKAELRQNVGLSTQVETERIERAVNRTSQGLFEIAFDPEFNQIALADNQYESYLDSVVSRWSADGMISIGLFNEDNELVAQAGPLSSQSIDMAAKTPQTTISVSGDAFLVETKPRIPTARRIYPGGRNQASLILVSEWDLGGLLGGAVSSQAIGSTTTTRLLSPTTTENVFMVLNSNDRSTVGTYVEFDLSTFEVEGLNGSHATTDQLTDGGKQVVAAVSDVGQTGWLSIVTVDQADAYSEIKVAKRYIILMFMLAGLTMLAIVMVIFRNFTRRLKRVAGLAEAISEGDLTGRINDPSMDALGNLSSTFDEMVAALAHDIDRREKVEAQLAYQANHDALTKLPNRSQLVQDLESLLSRSKEAISVLFMDLDGFKQVNDTLGHAVGDALLIHVADRLREITRPTDIAVRLGGDEFVVVLPGLSADEAGGVAKRIVDAISLPYRLGDSDVSISASIGIAGAGEDRDAETIIKEADLAMYAAKHGNRRSSD